jgi:hypothetical protein
VGFQKRPRSLLGHGEETIHSLPEPIESLRGVKVDAVAGGQRHALALADDGSVYAWGNVEAAMTGALGLGPSVSDDTTAVLTPQRVSALRVAPGGDWVVVPSICLTMCPVPGATNGDVKTESRTRRGESACGVQTIATKQT